MGDARSYRLEFDDPPSNDPSTPRMICRPTVLPIVRSALFTIACTTASPRRAPPKPTTPPSAPDPRHPSRLRVPNPARPPPPPSDHCLRLPLRSRPERLCRPLNRLLILRRKRPQRMLHPIPQLPQHRIRHIDRVLRHEEHPHPF